MEYGFKVQLPSNGLLGYPKEISMRSLMVGETKMFTGILDENREQKLSGLLRELTNIEDPDALTLGDREALIIYIRINSGLGIVEFSYTCPHCEHEDSANKNLEEVPIKELEAFEATQEQVGEYTLVGRPMLGSDAITAHRLNKMLPKVEEIHLQLLVTQVTDAENFEGILIEVKKLLAQPAGYLPALMKVLSKYQHGPEWEKATFECGGCQEALPFPAIRIFLI